MTLSPGAEADRVGELDRLLTEIYGNPDQRIREIMELWRELYDLPQLTNDFEVDDSFTTFWRRPTLNFVVVALFNYKDEQLLIYSPRLIAGVDVGARLPGGPILQGEPIEEAARRVVGLETRLEIDELIPITLVLNRFRSQGQVITHNGIAFMARTESQGLAVRRVITAVEDDTGGQGAQRLVMEDSPRSDAKFTNEVPSHMAFSNLEVLQMARTKLLSGVRVRSSGRPIRPHPEIIAASRLRVRLARTLHRHTTKRFLHYFASRPLRAHIMSYVGHQPSSFLDAAAGDDTLVCRLAMELNPRLCVANDISWRDMEPVRRAAHGKHINIIFTNHNLDALPFATKFEVVLFKNGLHHARNIEDAKLFLESLRRVAKKLIIVDVEDPRKRSYAKVFNWYYMRVLCDEGHRFCDWGQFRRLIRLCYGDARFELVRTIKGRYMCAVIDLDESDHGVAGSVASS